MSRISCKCSACGKYALVHCVVIFYNANQLPYCEDCWAEMFVATIRPQKHEDDGQSGMSAQDGKGN